MLPINVHNILINIIGKQGMALFALRIRRSLVLAACCSDIQLQYTSVYYVNTCYIAATRHAGQSGVKYTLSSKTAWIDSTDAGAGICTIHSHAGQLKHVKEMVHAPLACLAKDAVHSQHAM